MHYDAQVSTDSEVGIIGSFGRPNSVSSDWRRVRAKERSNSLRGTASSMAMIASVAKLKSNLTERGATRPSAIMRKKMPSGSSELQEMPRRREYPEGAEA